LKYLLYIVSFGIYLDVITFIERIIKLSNLSTSYLYFFEKSPIIANIISQNYAISFKY